jgi:addiction module RelE/StbE family toxin
VTENLTIRWTGPALKDLEELRARVSRDRPDAAKKPAREIRTRVEGLAGFRESGRVVPEIGIESYREVIVRSYRVIYEVREIEVVILRIWHTRRDLPVDVG